MEKRRECPPIAKQIDVSFDVNFRYPIQKLGDDLFVTHVGCRIEDTGLCLGANFIDFRKVLKRKPKAIPFKRYLNQIPSAHKKSISV